MDEISEKKHDLVVKYRELAESDHPDRNIARDLRQEINRCNFQFKHFIRGRSNPAGQYTGMVVGFSAGTMFYLYKNYQFGLIKRLLYFSVYGAVGGSLGLMLFTRIYCNKTEAKVNKLKFEATHHLDVEVSKYEEIIEEKLTRKE